MAQEPLPIPSQIVPERLSEEAYIALRKLEYDHALARLGLQGTLWGAVATLIVVIIIVLAQIWSKVVIIEGPAIAGMVAAFVIPIVFYGAFIFARALKVSGKAGKEGAAFEGSTGAAVIPKK
jgi:hypothetical protein